jgi:glycosyltransferase involved in cell wall biosynthesis
LASHPVAPQAWRADLGRPRERLRELTYGAIALQEIQRLEGVEVIHDHCGFGTLLGAALMCAAPVLHTVHGPIDEPEQRYYAALPGTIGLSAISRAQRSTAPDLRWVSTVHNAVDVDALYVGCREDKEPYLLCLARITREKGQHTAIEVARRVGMRLILAGKIEPTAEGTEYYERLIAPHIDGDRVVHLDNVGGGEKSRLLARARALLAPLEWEEPFGLFMVEAMASGTPAIAFPRGAAPELIIPGVTGFLARSVDEMVDAVRNADVIDPERCAQITRERFSPQAMARGYLAAYVEVMQGRTEPLASLVRLPSAAPAGELVGEAVRATPRTADALRSSPG